jgi:hypothetical protein
LWPWFGCDLRVAMKEVVCERCGSLLGDCIIFGKFVSLYLCSTPWFTSWRSVLCFVLCFLRPCPQRVRFVSCSQEYRHRLCFLCSVRFLCLILADSYQIHINSWRFVSTVIMALPLRRCASSFRHEEYDGGDYREGAPPAHDPAD